MTSGCKLPGIGAACPVADFAIDQSSVALGERVLVRASRLGLSESMNGRKYQHEARPRITIRRGTFAVRVCGAKGRTTRKHRKPIGKRSLLVSRRSDRRTEEKKG